MIASYMLNEKNLGSIMRGLLRFCGNHARILKVHLPINRMTCKQQKRINSLSKM